MSTPESSSRTPLAQWVLDGQVSAERVALHHITHDSAGVFRDLEDIDDVIVRERRAENPLAGVRARNVRRSMQPFATSTLDSLQTSALILDDALNVSVANRASLRMMGLREIDLLLQPFISLERGAWHMAGLQRGLFSLETNQHVLRLDHRFGDRQLSLEGRRVEHTRSFCLMLREQGRTAVLRDAGLRAEYEASPEAIIAASDDGEVLFANREAHRLFGFVPHAMVGHRLSRLLHTPDQVRSPEATRAAQRLEARRADGSKFQVDLALNWIAFEGRPVVLCTVADASTDDSELLRMPFEATIVAERERRRIAVELHDRIGQSLALARIKLKSLSTEGEPPDAHALHEALTLIDEATNDTRTLSFELSPPVLFDLGLSAALSWLAEDLHDKHGFSVELDDTASPFTLDEVTAAVVFRCARELLMNALKHAGVPAATVHLRTLDAQLQLVLEDGGVGFDVEATLGSPRKKGFGLASVRAQLRRLGGDLVATSARGVGSRFELRLPLQRAR